MAHFDIPLRNRKDLSRAAQMRTFGALGRPFGSRSATSANYEDAYMPSPRPRFDRNRVNPYYPSPVSPYQTDQSFGPDFPNTFSSYRPTSSYPRQRSPEYSTNARLSFPKAMRALHHALHAALSHAVRLDETFKNEMRYVPYADERTRAHLWKLKVEFNGWNAEADPTPEMSNQFEPFAKYASRLLDAIEDIHNAEHPSSHDWPELRQRGGGGYDDLVEMEDVRLAMKKLDVSFGAMMELLDGVKAERQRCVVLIRELRSAVEILETIRVVWEVPRNGKGGNARGHYQGSKASTSSPDKVSDTDTDFGPYAGCEFGPAI